MKIEEIPIWEAFYGVAKYGNFTRASHMLRVPVPQLSKRVTKLEGQLGVRLFQRSTRIVTLTDEGKALLPKVASILEDLSALETLFEKTDKITGTIRITCVPFIAHRLLIPVIEEYTKQNPEVEIHLDLSEKLENILESNFDVAIRIQEPKDSDLVYRKLLPNDLVFCASPKYLKKKPTPRNLSDLYNHDLLALSLHRNCRFKNEALKLGDFYNSRSITCENGWYLTELALRDFGILTRSIWDVQNYLKSGQLVQVLKKHPLETFGHIYAVIPSRRFLAPRVRVFIDFLLSHASKWSAAC